MTRSAAGRPGRRRRWASSGPRRWSARAWWSWASLASSCGRASASLSAGVVVVRVGPVWSWSSSVWSSSRASSSCREWSPPAPAGSDTPGSHSRRSVRADPGLRGLVERDRDQPAVLVGGGLLDLGHDLLQERVGRRAGRPSRQACTAAALPSSHGLGTMYASDGVLAGLVRSVSEMGEVDVVLVAVGAEPHRVEVHERVAPGHVRIAGTRQAGRVGALELRGPAGLVLPGGPVCRSPRRTPSRSSCLAVSWSASVCALAGYTHPSPSTWLAWMLPERRG